MDRFDDDMLAAELRLMRPTPRPGFAAELDERAAAGFPRRVPRAGVAFARLAERAMNPRRLLVPVVSGAIALCALAIVVVAITTSGGGGSSSSIADSVSGTVGSSGSSGKYADEAAGSAAGESSQMAPAHKPSGNSHGPSNGAAGGGESSGGAVYEPEVPAMATDQKSSSGAAAAGNGEIGEEIETLEEVEAGRGSGAGAMPSSMHVRAIERSAYVVLGTKPDEVSSAAGKVFEAVHAADGVVLHSSVHSGKTGATGASFALLIPSAKVDDALAAISQIAEVRERHDATKDITAPTVSATEELRDSNASIEGLLKELGNVETEAERESVEAQLREERHHHAAIRASLDNLHERAAMSEVSVRIVTSKRANVTPPAKGSEGGWGVGDALHDAGHILTIAAAVLLIALAVLAPIALIALLAWLTNRFRVRRLRERALG